VGGSLDLLDLFPGSLAVDGEPGTGRGKSLQVVPEHARSVDGERRLPSLAQALDGLDGTQRILLRIEPTGPNDLDRISGAQLTLDLQPRKLAQRVREVSRVDSVAPTCALDPGARDRDRTGAAKRRPRQCPFEYRPEQAVIHEGSARERRPRSVQDEDHRPAPNAGGEGRRDRKQMARPVGHDHVCSAGLSKESPPAGDRQRPARPRQEQRRNSRVGPSRGTYKTTRENPHVPSATTQSLFGGLDELLDTACVGKDKARNQQDFHGRSSAVEIRRGCVLVKSPAERWEGGQPIARLQPQEPAAEQPVDLRRYASALRRSSLLIALIVTGVSALVLTLSLALPKTYSATSTVLLDPTPGFTESETDVARRLATIRTLLTTREVLTRAARRIEGESPTTLEDKVSASVDPKANIISIDATDGSADGAAEIANSVAAVFLTRQTNAERRRLARTEATLRQAIVRLRGTRGARTEIDAIRERLSELSVTQASAGSELQLAEAARPPATAVSPRPVRNTVFAVFASLFIAILVAVGRERIAPRVSGSQELSELSGLPILTQIMQPRSRRFGSNGNFPAAEREAYQMLSALIGLQLGPARQHSLLVTSAVPDEGKAEVTAGLGRALALAGEKTLVVRADMRRRSGSDSSGEEAPGLAEILATTGSKNRQVAAELLADPGSSLSARDGEGSLAVLGAGNTPANSARLLSGDALDGFFDALARSDYTYVLIEGPPLLGVADCRFWAQRVDGTLVVSRPDLLEPSDVVEVREVLESLDAKALGHIVVSSNVARA
jgi:Mrp family chromosome partitioning ATPase